MNIVLQRMGKPALSVINEDQQSVRTVGLLHLGKLGQQLGNHAEHPDAEQQHA